MKKMKRTIAVILCVALALSAAFVFTPAKTDAKDVKNKTIVLKVGQKYQLWASGIGSNIKWTSSKEKVATVSKGGLIKAKMAGKTKITAKGSRGKVSCKIIVKDTKKSAMTKSISVTTTILDDSSVICTVKNDYRSAVPSVTVNLKLYDTTGAAVGTDKIKFYNVPGKGSAYSKVIVEGNSSAIDTSKTKTSFTITTKKNKTTYTDANKYLTAKDYSVEAKKTTITFTNTTKKKLNVEGYYEYRDAAGKLVGISWINTTIEAGQTATELAADPVNAAGEGIVYATTAFVGQAHNE